MKRRTNLTAEKKVEILKRHLVDRVPVSDLCEEYGVQPTAFYRWQRALFENATLALLGPGSRRRQREEEEERIVALQEKLRKKDEVLGELMEEYVAVKKNSGGN